MAHGRPLSPGVATAPAPLRLAATAAFVLLAALLAVLYARRALSGWGTGPVPYDLVTFLRAADDVLAGRNPFPDAAALTGDANYVYPPLLALALVPLAVLPVSLAVLLWTVLGLAAVAGALWALDVRDPRVLVLVLAWPATRDAVGAGTVGPLLALGIALAWRGRDARPVRAGVAAGLAVSLKLFTWPVLAWLALTRRARQALVGVAVAVAAVLCSWAAVGFAGLREYPDVLRRLSELEADRSYSLVAVAAALGAGAAGAALSILVGAALLLWAVRLERDAGLPRRDRDRRALTAVLAAALALTPILWIHYLVLLLVPLALARPRLSPLWVVPALPLAGRAFGWEPAGWPEGDALSLAVVLGVALVVLGACLRRDEPAAPAPVRRPS